ncbi:acyl carrier protein [Actinomadura fulvescens]|uniref:Acyl carrier protein n=1 Tax=Actinomadura fulvescens TaxID=46160 RepID=A0ABN3QSU5_9ACTN
MIDDERLRRVFRSALDLGEDVVVDVLEYRGIDKWDSLAHMSLVAALEDEFDIMIDIDDVIDMSSFSKARELVEKHVV